MKLWDGSATPEEMGMCPTRGRHRPLSITTKGGRTALALVWRQAGAETKEAEFCSELINYSARDVEE